MKEIKKILLALLPFWTPLIPPQGIGHLKAFLEKHGYRVKTVDANIEQQFKEIYQDYFDSLREYIPQSNWGNFYNIGHDVLRNHMMAHFNHTVAVKESKKNHEADNKKYNELVRLLIYNTYFWYLDEQKISRLNAVIGRFFDRLECYFLDLLEKEKPDIVGLTAHLGTLAACLFSFKLTKERYPGIKTVVGGSIFAGELPMVSPDFEFLLQKAPYIDNVIVGEGENLFLKLLNDELPKSKRVFTSKDIGNEQLEINAIDIPDFSDFTLEHYPYMAAFASKSCPYQCRFCNVAPFYGEYRERSAEHTVNYILDLYKRYGYQLYFMTDSLLNPIMTNLSNEFIKRGITMYLDTYMRVSSDVCDRDKTLLWRRGGLYRTRLGIETGSPRLLEAMGKEITVEQSKAALSSLAYAGIKTTAYFVIGFPGETEEDFQQTLDYIKELKTDIWQVECNPFYYFYAGQNNADQWADIRMLLYPEYARDLLISQTWILNCEPTREERFRRMFRLVEHCKRLGIPNPYSTEEIYEADERWRNLHENAVPPLAEFENNTVYIDDTKHVKRFIMARDTRQGEGDFMF